MNKLLGKSSLIVLVVMALLILGQTARATVSITLTDVLLIESSRVIVIGEVASTSCQWDDAHQRIYTYVKLNVSEILKGNIQGQQIVLKQLGGEVDGTEMVVDGAPGFANGEKVLLFLNSARDGTLRVAHLFQGKYEILNNGTVKRGVNEAVVSLQSAGAEYTDSAELNSFKDKIRRTIAEHPVEVAHYEQLQSCLAIVETPFEYWDSGVIREQSFTPQFVLLGRRWFEPDTGQTVYYYVNANAAPIGGGGITQVDQALAAWTNVSSSSLKLTNGGSTDTRGFRADGVSTISFGDPDGMMDNPVNCVGIIALGGYVSTGGQSITIGGVTFGQITEGDVVLNNNFECILGNSANLAEVICHEIGHTIGLGHSSDSISDPAIMRSWMHGNGRGATLAQDDINGLTALYPGPKVDEPPVPVFDYASFVSQVVPQTMIAGQKYRVTVTMLNSGTGKWKSGKGYYLGAQNPQGNTTWNTDMIFIDGKVKPNQQVEFTFKIKAPSQPGQYYFQWGMERNGQSFGQPSQLLLINVVSQ